MLKNPLLLFLHMYIGHVYERERQRPAPPLRGPRRAPGYSKNNPKVLQGFTGFKLSPLLTEFEKTKIH